jgi:cytochrome c553
MCSSCHGPEGRSVSPTFPRLAGQQKDYLIAQLKAFRDHTRADPHAHTYMWGMASGLSDATIEGIGAYYAALTPVPGTTGDPAATEAGRRFYQQGIADRSIPACASCHGDKGQGMGEFPRLAGQHQGYLEIQLAAFATNARANEVMHATAKDLTPDEVWKIAAYLASE